MSLDDVPKAKVAAHAVTRPELATPVEVADFMHTTTATLAQERYQGRGIPYVKHGRRVLYRWDDVHAYLDANTVNPQDAA